MPRLITFGCSLTYGQYLDTKKDLGGKTSSANSWPSRLAERLNYELINYAIPGASNKEIAWMVFHNYKPKPNDCVIIHWTDCERWCIIRGPEVAITQYSVGRQPSTVIEQWANTSYYKQHSDPYDSVRTSWMLQLAAVAHLKQQGIYYLMTKPQRKDTPVWEKCGITGPGTLEEIRMFLCDRALDGAHPGIKTNQCYSDYVFDQIKDGI